MKINMKSLLIAIFGFVTALWTDSTFSIEDGDYKIRCHTRNGGLRCLEAFPGADSIRPRIESWDQDQKWTIKSIGSGYYNIICFTRNGGLRYLEAFPGADVVRPRAEWPGNQDQKWSIQHIDSGFYRILCNTANKGPRSLEAFPGAENGEGLVRPRENSLDQDQRWQFIKW